VRVRKEEIEALGEVAGEALAASGTLIRDMHEGIAGRPFGVLGPAAAPVRFVHDRVSGALYDGVGAALRAGARSSVRVLAGPPDENDGSLTARPGAGFAVAALNGMYGNHLVARGNALALGMEVRRNGREVAVKPDALGEAFPDATSRIVVFVHGLGETDEAWRVLPRRGRGRRPRRTYGERLQDELSFTPIHLRYNSGLRVSQNGRALAELLDAVVTGWPTGVEEVVLVGHSMGGLVARSACYYGEVDGRAWTGLVRHVFCLGTPHLGADLEKGVNALASVLGRLPETRGFGKVLNARSAGIKDLRYGSCVDEDWSDCDPDEFLRDRCQEVPFLADASYYFVAATLSAGPLGTLLGDLLVRSPSASGRGNGRGRSVAFEVDNGHELAGATHFDLLNHPDVYNQMRTWITRPASSRRQLAGVAVLR
jgi:pimeloyl-ACP methyl ester carboxylesterase